jgi:hypothetical protein
MSDTTEVAIMTDAKYQRCFEVAPLEFLDSSMLGVQIVQAVCGGGAATYDRLRCAAWFNPGHHLDWYGSIYWRGAQAGRVAPPASPEAGDASSVGYRLPITWGSSPKH